MSGGGGSTTPTNKQYLDVMNDYMNSTLLSDKQKQTFLGDLEKARADYVPGRDAFGRVGLDEYKKEAFAAAKYSNRLADEKAKAESQKVYVQEQFNALNQATNSKLQQSKITNFIGATSVRAII